MTNPRAAAHLESVDRTLTDWGIGYHKLDFLCAGAIDGRRYEDCPPLDAYREGLRLIRRAVGEEAILLGCGAPLLPSIGLVDACASAPMSSPRNTVTPTRDSPGRWPTDARASSIALR